MKQYLGLVTNFLLGIGLLLWAGGCGKTTTVTLPPGGGGVPFSGLTWGDSTTCDVVTWNVEQFPKNGATTVDYFVAAVAALHPDIVALQEITGPTSFQHVVDELPGYAGYRAASAAYELDLAFLYDTTTVAVDTVYEIFTDHSYNSPFPRRPLVLECRFENTDMIVVDNHLKAFGDQASEERRRTAIHLLHDYIEENWPNRAVVVLGDMNDNLTDPVPDNVFQDFLDDPDHYRFADMAIATGPAADWSYHGQSHIDHILVSDELFDALAADGTSVATLRLDRELPGGYGEYDSNLSDHLPVGMRLVF